MIPKKIKAEWVAALRSGDYKQGKHTMYNQEYKRFCCLGVLEHVCMGGRVETSFDPSDEFLRHAPYVNAYLALPTGKFYDEYNICLRETGIEQRLINMNDSGMSFADIADYIEQNVETYY